MSIKKLYIYIIRTFLPLLVASFMVALFIVVMQMLWMYIDDLVGKGVDGIVFLKLLYYASMTAAPLALVLAVLLASLMAYGNLGERFELLAMKTAGIPLHTIFKPVFWFVALLSVWLFWFQNDYMITSQVRFWQYYFSIKNKSPELAIPEGSFYKELEGYSIYVERKDNNAKMLYGMMIYDLTKGFENASVVVADSGRIYSAEEGTMLILEMYSGEAFRNLDDRGNYYGNALRPYMRERFTKKEVQIPFSASLDMLDESVLSSQFVGKNVVELKHYTDSLKVQIDSLATINATSVEQMPYLNRTKLLEPPTETNTGAETANLYATLAAMGYQGQSQVLQQTIDNVRSEQNRLYFTVEQQAETADLHRKNSFEYWRKFTYPAACLAFFFIGAPLGALIRRGGLGVPFIVAVFFFILFYLLESMGMKLVREGTWVVWAGMWLPNMVLYPIGFLLFYIATKDTTRFNFDVVTTFFKRYFGTSTTRKLEYKEVAMDDANFALARQQISSLEQQATLLLQQGHLSYSQFFLNDTKFGRRQELNQQLEALVKNLSNARDRLLVHNLGSYPFLHDLSRTMRTTSKGINTALMFIFPLGIIIYAIYVARNKRYIKELQRIRSTNALLLQELDRVERETNHNNV